MADNLKSLIKKRSSFKSKVTIFANHLNPLKDCPVLSQLQQLDLQERLAKFECLYSEFDALQTDIEVLADESGAVFTEREDFERQYFSLLALARSLLSPALEPGSASSFHNANSGAFNHKQNFIRLPKINLPNFDGNYQGWLEFRDTFISLIHDNSCIDDINKFHYLRASLQGNAASIIKNIDFKSDHYKVAWDLLCERYNNNRLLINNHLQTLFDVKSISEESSASLRSLVDTINKNVRALTSLKQPTNHWDTILIFIMTKKLDNRTNRSWEEFRDKMTEDPTLQKFCTFLSRKADLLESVESNNTNKNTTDNNNNSSIVALNNSHNSTNTNNNTNTKNTQHKNTNNNKNKNKFRKCPLCSSAHTLYSCELFRNLSIENRVQKANELKVCLNCLNSGHSTKQCKMAHCRYCSLKHNTLLHLESQSQELIKNPLPSTSHSSLPVTSDNTALSANSMQLATSSHVLLSTAMVNVTGATGQKYTARLLLDNGSTANFAKSKWCVASGGELKPGLLVLVKDKMAPPLLWCLGRVVHVYPGVDGIARVADVKTKKGTMRRDFTSICPLPIEE